MSTALASFEVEILLSAILCLGKKPEEVRRCVIFAWNVSYDKVELNDKITSVPERRWHYFRLEEPRD